MLSILQRTLAYPPYPSHCPFLLPRPAASSGGLPYAFNPGGARTAPPVPPRPPVVAGQGSVSRPGTLERTLSRTGGAVHGEYCKDHTLETNIVFYSVQSKLVKRKTDCFFIPLFRFFKLSNI